MPVQIYRENLHVYHIGFKWIKFYQAFKIFFISSKNIYSNYIKKIRINKKWIFLVSLIS